MKHFCILFLLLAPLVGAAQTVVAPDSVYEYKSVDIQPEFDQGKSNIYVFIGKNFHYPAQSAESMAQGKVFSLFIIEKDGSVSDIKIVKGVDAAIDKEVERVLSLQPKWTPAKKNGVPVRCYFFLPISVKSK